MRAFCCTVVFVLTAFELHAGALTTACFDGSSNRSFQTSEDFPGSNQMPSVQYDSDGNPATLGWEALPKDVFVALETVGRYNNKAIWRAIYRKQDAVDPAVRPFVGAFFGYELATPKGPRIRPFFVAVDENIRSIESCFTVNRAQPFALTISNFADGSGKFWSEYTYVFTANTVRMLQRREGGRKMDVTTYRYNRAGKATTTARAGNE